MNKKTNPNRILGDMIAGPLFLGCISTSLKVYTNQTFIYVCKHMYLHINIQYTGISSPFPQFFSRFHASSTCGYVWNLGIQSDSHSLQQINMDVEPYSRGLKTPKMDGENLWKTL